MFFWKRTSEYWLCSLSGKANTVMLLQNLLERRLRQTVRCTKCVNFDTRNHSLLSVSYQKSTLETPATDQMSCSIKVLLYRISVLQMRRKDGSNRNMETFPQMRLTLYAALSFPFATSFFTPFLSRVHMERGVFLPGVLLPLLPHPAGWARLWYLPLLQD